MIRGDDMFITNGLGKDTPLNLTWLDEDEIVNEKLVKSKSAKKNRKKVDVRLPRPVTRSQKKRNDTIAEIGGSTLLPGRATRARKQTNRSK
jgi:hypothetical protein